MNILQITNYQCASMSANDNTGINRVVTALSNYYVTSCGNVCYNAYYQKNPSGQAELFSNGLQLTIPLATDVFKRFLTDNGIDIIVINVSNIEYVMEIHNINAIAHQCNVKTIYCIHFMPGYEACSYADFSLVRYNITHGTNCFDTLKKWIISFCRPVSTKVIQKVIRKHYSLPLSSCDKVVVFSTPYIQRYLDIARTNNREKFAVIPNPLPFDSFLDNDELICKEKEVIVVGRLFEHQKRLSYALHVWRMVEQNPELQDWHLSIIGDGVSGSYYRWLAHKLKLRNITFTGKQDPQPYYKKASILLSTSIYEGWPMVLMECMPMGVVPCVFNSYESATEIIDHNQNGIAVSENNLKAYYECLKELMLNRTKCLSMASAAIEKSRSFNIDRIGDYWQALFRNCREC